MRPASKQVPRRKSVSGGRESLRRLPVAAAIAVIGLLAVPVASASALTLGSTTLPSGASPGPCEAGALIVQKATDSAYTYTVPSAGGAIVSWSLSTLDGTAGAPVTLAVLRPTGAKSFTVVGIDQETLPNPLPAGGVATFKIASPITATGGDVLGLTSTGGSGCDFGSGVLTAADTAYLVGLESATVPTVGATYEAAVEGEHIILSVSAELLQSQDDGVTAAAMPSSITAGGIAEYAFTVSNAGVGNGPISFSDAVPSGLTILSAVAGSGTCAVAGQTVSCTISGLQPGSSAPVLIIVSAASSGSFADAASVSSTLQDPNPANNSASATLNVSSPAPTTTCKTVKLAGVTLSIAKLVIPALDCKLGKIKHATSKTVKKGLVITTSPGAGKMLSAGTAVNVTISSGRPKPKKKG
jgi:hypothetical protein